MQSARFRVWQVLLKEGCNKNICGWNWLGGESASVSFHQTWEGLEWREECFRQQAVFISQGMCSFPLFLFLSRIHEDSIKTRNVYSLLNDLGFACFLRLFFMSDLILLFKKRQGRDEDIKTRRNSSCQTISPWCCCRPAKEEEVTPWILLSCLLSLLLWIESSAPEDRRKILASALFVSMMRSNSVNE